jgi:O-antigen ligase
VVDTFKRLGRLTLDIAWAATILLLPITSLPLLSRLAGNTAVAPASLIPFAWIVLFWFACYVVKQGTLPRESIPFLLFVSVAVIASALAFFLNTPPFKDTSIAGEETSAILTLLIGAAFYLVTAGWLAKSQSRVLFTLKLVDVSGSILLLWAALQGYYIYLFESRYPAALAELQQIFSTRGLFYGRITAFAFEPSWLAHQLNLLFFPFWLAATVTGWSAFRFRLWKISLENILLAIGTVVIFLSSRVGTLSLFLVLAFLGIYINIHLARNLQKWTLEHFDRFPLLLQKILRGVLPVILLLAFLGAYTLAAIILVYGLSHMDWRLARFFQVTFATQVKLLTDNIYQFFNYLAFAERFVYWVAGWRVFNLSPLFGVGLGNAGFYFQHALPSYSWSLPEVMDTYFRESTVPNIKSLWIRLLAETGIVGFSSFLTWYFVVFRSAWSIRISKSHLFKTVGWFGLFVLIAFIIEGFSTDTFALPYLWLSLGIVCATAAMFRKQLREQATDPALDTHSQEDSKRDARI